MKRSLLFTIYIFFSFCLCLYGQTDRPDQIRINYGAVDKPIDTVLQEIFELSGVSIMYNNNLIPDKEIRIVARNKTIGNILNDIFDQTDLDYEIVGDQIVVVKSPDKYVTQKFLVSGYISDSLSGERILFANIYTDDLKIGVGSNAYGYYNVELKPGRRVLNFSYLGYEKKSIIMDVNRDTIVNVIMMPNLRLNEIVIEERRIVKERKSLSESEKISLSKMHSLPALGGEPDIMRMAQVQTGVTTGSDGTGGLNVRGGSVDQNLILLDGVPIYNAGHALGIFSVFNSSMIKSAELIKNGFPARYGGRLSSVMDIRTKDGDMDDYHGDIGISPVSGRFTLEGPIIKKRASFIFSARRSILDVWLKQLDRFNIVSDEQLGNLNYYFSDINAKINLDLGKNNKIYFSYYQGGDKFQSSSLDSTILDDGTQLKEIQQTEWNWGNRLGTVRWNTLISNRMFVNLSAYFSEFEVDLFEINRQEYKSEIANNIFYTSSLNSSKVSDLGLSSEFEYRVSTPYSIFFGFNATNHNFNPGSLSITEDDMLVPLGDEVTLAELKDTLALIDEVGLEYRGYIENQFETRRIKMNLGLHVSAIDVSEEQYLSFQPRVSIWLKLGNALSWEGAYSKMNQYLHLLSNTGLGLPNDIWLPSTSALKPQQATQYSSKINIDLSQQFELQLGGYYKTLDNLISQPTTNPISTIQIDGWENQIPIGSGQAYGLEFSLNKKLGRISGFLNYTLSTVNHEFDNRVNQGAAFPARYDRRHNLHTAWLWRINDNIEFSTNWSFGTGNPFTLPEEFSVIELPNGNIIINAEITEINNKRLDDYHRLDLALNFYKKLSWGQQKITLGVYNTYNQFNTFYVDYKRTKLRDDRPIFEKVSIFPIIPSISYNLAF